MKKSLLILLALIIILAIGQSAGLLKLPKTVNPIQLPSVTNEKRTVVNEESVVTKVIAEALPSVVTVGINQTTSTGDSFQVNPFDPLSPFKQIPGTKKNINQNIGSGFIISNDGLIITNKHVVADTNATYTILTNDNKKYSVDKIYRDPVNDISILKINASSLKPLKLGDSSTLKLGQTAIAIGTPLGEFTNTVTTGIISGLGRGITAGSPYEGYVEKLDNVIQTDAAISPGNSGGPLLNSSGEVVGINTAIASGGQNIGFAIPSNVIKGLIDNFNKRGGTFERPYLGVRYKMIDTQTAVLNDLVEGAYIVEVIQNSPADKSGLQPEDIIIELDGQKIKGDNDTNLAKIIDAKKIGDTIQIKIWRNKEIKTIQLKLEAMK